MTFMCRTGRSLCLRIPRASRASSCLAANKDTFFVTTPIFYVNAAPHVGHVYTAVLGDALARWQALKRRRVLFSTGTDEHGQKVQRAAERDGIETKLFCDQVSAKFKDVFEKIGVAPSDYIRTTEDRHVKAAQHFWRVLEDRGCIYKGKYEGWYCTPDEAFLPALSVEEKLDKDGTKVMVSRESGHVVEWLEEENYMFRLSNFSDRLLRWLEQDVIQPSSYGPVVRTMILEGLSDLSVSRQRSRLPWGIPVPGDNSQTMYVWLDALTNYLTVGGYPAVNHLWPADCHIVGKDIIKFHAVFWPAFLMAAGLDPPRRILCHAHWLTRHTKMSKSTGNVVEPWESMRALTAEGLRYFLLREGTPHSDNNFDHSRAVEVVNKELADTLGNLLGRVTSVKVNPRQIIHSFDAGLFEERATREEKEMWRSLRKLPDQVDEHFNRFEINVAVNDVMQRLRDTNVFLQTQEPWQLVKEPSNAAWLRTVLFVAYETLRVCGILLQPVVPLAADKLLTQLNVSTNHRTWDYSLRDYYTKEVPLGPDSGLIFKKVE